MLPICFKFRLHIDVSLLGRTKARPYIVDGQLVGYRTTSFGASRYLSQLGEGIGLRGRTAK